MKYRALRLDGGNFSWGSECATRKTRIIDVVYNASNNELVRTKTLVKNAIVVVDATPFRQWYESHYLLPLGRKKGAKLTEAEDAIINKKRSKKTAKKYKTRQRLAKVEQGLEEQFHTGRLLGICYYILCYNDFKACCSLVGRNNWMVLIFFYLFYSDDKYFSNSYLLVIVFPHSSFLHSFLDFLFYDENKSFEVKLKELDRFGKTLIDCMI